MGTNLMSTTYFQFSKTENWKNKKIMTAQQMFSGFILYFPNILKCKQRYIEFHVYLTHTRNFNTVGYPIYPMMNITFICIFII